MKVLVLGAGQHGSAAAFDLLRNPEVDDLRSEFSERSLTEHDVVGREISMNDALEVDLAQTHQDLPRHFDRLG